MELQFDKTQLPYLRSVVWQTQKQELTQELKLSEDLPDIGKVLAAWGQVLLRGKEWRSAGMSVNGGVMVWVLYLPEDGGQPQCVETWLPFQLKWDFPDTERDGTIIAIPGLQSVDARSVSARKLMLRACVCVQGKAVVPDMAELSLPGEVPQDVQLLKNSYPLQLPAEAGEKAFTLDMELSLPASVPPAERIVRYALELQLHEQKLVSDKLVFRGIGVLHMLYLSADGRLHSWDFEIPFSQYAELEREWAPDAPVQLRFAVTDLELARGAEENFNLKAGVTGQYLIYDTPMVELVEDAYSPRRTVKLSMGELKLPSVLDMRSDTLHMAADADVEGKQMADLAFYAEPPQLHREGDSMETELAGSFQMLFYDETGGLRSAQQHWQDTWRMDVSRDAAVEVTARATGKPVGTLDMGTASLRGELAVEAATVADRPMFMVTGVELGEEAEPDPNRPSLILCRAGEDSLWDIAKKTGSTVAAIQKANGLQQEPGSDRILLIPVS